MGEKKIGFYLVYLLLAVFGLETASANIDIRPKVIELLQSSSLSEKLYAPVNISADQAGIVCIADEGTFLMQYMIAEPNNSNDPNIAVDPNLKIPSSAKNVVIVTHGWIDKADNEWPADIATEIRKKVDPNQWLCGFFDWRGGAAVVNPIDAVKYARDIAAPRLAKAVLKLGEFEHIHLIAHSAGCWAIGNAAKIIATDTKAQIHLTFLDAYVPPGWTESDLGNIKNQNTWAEHYYTKDMTLSSTQKNLTHAHNIDITKIDPCIKEHEFPYRWYYATIAGEYRNSDWESGDKVLTSHDGLDYGFARSAEAGQKNWQKSLTLQKGNQALKLTKPRKKPFHLNIFKKSKDEK